ncbi:MAG: hypothetical protein JSU96_01975 [Acidobacteriota bacterium]|nr:MAG: hypothetical protein JSU96_01975 [Acidobacteriota bacterium]
MPVLPFFKNPVESRYRRDGKTYLIDIKVENLSFLFDERDPSPLRNRDLHDDIVSYIIGSLREIPLKSPVKLNILIEDGNPGDVDHERIVGSVLNHFEFETHLKAIELRRTLRKGVKAMLTGLGFLFLSLSSVHYISSNYTGFVWEYLVEGLSILSWVSMWFPIHVFLYEWWPILDDLKVFRKARALETEISATGVGTD